jgi:tetratricopeptide (TPR) repeat protein
MVYVIFITIGIFIAFGMLIKYYNKKESIGQERGPLSRLEGIPSTSGENSREFLYPLSREEKVAVTGLSPAVYDAIIEIKRTGRPTTSVNLDSSSRFDLGSLLDKLDIADLERLAESLKLTLQADRAAASDATNAAQLYQQALQLNPFDAVATMSCGVLLAQQGNLREGMKWLKHALELDPNNGRIKRNLAAIKSHL